MPRRGAQPHRAAVADVVRAAAVALLLCAGSNAALSASWQAAATARCAAGG
jgi:hypothetical protein